MGFINIDNTKIFDDFWHKYGQSLQHIDDITVESSNDVLDINNPYGIDTSKVPMNIKRYRIQCSRFNFSQREEFALIAHELGHANIKKNNIQCKGLQEEFEADDYAVGLGLRSELKSALEKICRGYQDNSGGFFDIFGLQDPKKDLGKRITRL